MAPNIARFQVPRTCGPAPAPILTAELAKAPDKILSTTIVVNIRTNYYICRMSQLPLPSEAELLLLRALWEHPAATVQQVHEWITAAGKDVSYTTVLTQLQRMHRKGLVTRVRVGKQHQYRAAVDRSTTETALVEQLSNTVFAGSALKLAMKALGTDQPTPEELDALERWIAEQKDNR